MAVDLAPHQQLAVSKLHNGSILCGGVGVGKTRVAIQYYVEKEAPKDVYVITTARKRDSLDWEHEAVRHGIGTRQDATVGGVIHVDSWNNLWKYEDVTDAFFIFDEQRLVGSGVWVQTFLKIAKHNNWILLSATPGDNWLDYIPVFVANGFYKNRTEFGREHVVYARFTKFPKVERYIGVGKLVRLRKSILVEMPYQRHTHRNLIPVPVDYDTDLFKRVVKDRWHVYENRPLRDAAELYAVMRKIVNSDPTRLGSIHMLMEKHPRLIVFYNFDYELEILRTLFTSDSKLFTNTKIGMTSSAKILTEESRESNSVMEQKNSPTSIERSESNSSKRLCTEKEKTSNQLGLSRENQTKEEQWTESHDTESKTLPSSSLEHSPKSSNKLLKTSSSCPTQSASKSISHIEVESQRQNESSSSIETHWQHCETIPPTPAMTTIGTQSDSSQKPHPSTEKDGTISENQTRELAGSTTAQTRCSPSLSASTPVHIAEALDQELSQTTTQPILICTKKQSKESRKTPQVSSIDGEIDPLVETKPSDFSLAEWNGHKHEPIPKTDRWVYLVQYQSGAEAWNCVETNVSVFYSLNYSYRMFEQCQGRTDRMNTPFQELYYYVLRSYSWIDDHIWEALMRKEDFNEKEALKTLAILMTGM